MSKKQKVAITGIGLINPIANNTIETWNLLLKGKSGLSFLEKDELKDYPCKVFGLVKNEKEILNKVFSFNNQRKTDRFIHLAMIAGKEALLDSGLSKELPVNRERFGTSIGVGFGGIQSIETGKDCLIKKGLKRVSPFLIPQSIINQAAAHLSMEHNLQGPTCSIVNACSSSGDSVGNAFRMIRDGYADYMLTGGTESSITPLSIAAFGNMRAITHWKKKPEKACRPFDKDRSGFVMSEGAGILLLERMDLAKKRGANIYAEIVGYGSTSDAYHITAMHPEGRGAIKAIQVALKDAKINKNEIGYINAHGTSTKMNDIIETKVLKNVFLDHISPKNPNRALVSSTKSMTGHMLGAAGGVEISLTALALKNETLPPTINLDHPDDECNLDYIPHYARDKKCEYAISNSFGFGGGNSVIVLKKI
ncbi:beta-ketoacyl-ACP synthase II [Candidatus Dependentiae bacterium]|nr:beta-ketoacyl-ACP synthase II [Candidatus Dependentiae bacterium]